jgi:hypothetical protein
VARDLHVTKQTVGKWRSRFVAKRLDGLLDEPRPGAPRTVTDAAVERVVTLTLETTPRDADALEHAGYGAAVWRGSKHGQPDLPRVPFAATPERDVQAVGGSVVHRQGLGTSLGCIRTRRT